MTKFTVGVALGTLLALGGVAQADGLFDWHYRNARFHTDADVVKFRNHCLRADENNSTIVFPSATAPGDLVVQYPNIFADACNFYKADICSPKRCKNPASSVSNDAVEDDDNAE